MVRLSQAIEILQNLKRWHGDLELLAEFCGDQDLRFVALGVSSGFLVAVFIHTIAELMFAHVPVFAHVPLQSW